jgi:hypothetical protein
VVASTGTTSSSCRAACPGHGDAVASGPIGGVAAIGTRRRGFGIDRRDLRFDTCSILPFAWRPVRRIGKLVEMCGPTAELPARRARDGQPRWGRDSDGQSVISSAAGQVGQPTSSTGYLPPPTTTHSHGADWQLTLSIRSKANRSRHVHSRNAASSTTCVVRLRARPCRSALPKGLVAHQVAHGVADQPSHATRPRRAGAVCRVALPNWPLFRSRRRLRRRTAGPAPSASGPGATRRKSAERWPGLTGGVSSSSLRGQSATSAAHVNGAAASLRDRASSTIDPLRSGLRSGNYVRTTGRGGLLTGPGGGARPASLIQETSEHGPPEPGGVA